MNSVLSSSVVDRGFVSRSGQAKDFKIKKKDQWLLGSETE
jgi:hypothetical protein